MPELNSENTEYASYTQPPKRVFPELCQSKRYINLIYTQI